MRRMLLGSAVLGLVFVANPAFLACKRGPSFGEREAVAVVAVVGAHRTYAFSHEGAAYELVVDVTQSDKARASRGRSREGFLRTAYACGDRTFVKSASACMEVTKIPVIGDVTLVRARDGKKETVLDRVAVEGVLEEIGDTLGESQLALGGANGAAFTLDSRDARAFSLREAKFGGVTWRNEVR